jgi:hypothetical protein
MRRTALATLAAPLLAATPLCLAHPAPARAQEGPDTGELLERLPDALREEAGAVHEDPTVRCEVEEHARCSPRTYRFLLNHLPLAARALEGLSDEERGDEGLAAEGLGSYTITAQPDGHYGIDDHAGATADAEVVLEEEGLLVIIARGQLEVPLLPPIPGTGVIVLRYASDPDDPQVMSSRCAVSFRVDDDTLHRLTSPFRRTLRRVLGRKLGLLIRSAVGLAQACEDEPWEVYAGLRRAAGVRSDDLRAFREQFLSY